MKACLLTVLSLLATSSSAASRHVTEKEAMVYAKAIDIKMLDPSLPSRGLEDWLRLGPPHIEALRWELDETCDLHPDAKSDYPSCVRVTFKRGGQEGYFLVLVGTLRTGITGPPKLYGGIDVMEAGFVQTGGTDQLSGLPNLLDQPAVTGDVGNLYQEVVARHPIGLPKASDKTAMLPYLSHRLAQQLNVAQVCQVDYFRQHPRPGVVPKPRWMTSDLFAGEDDRAALFFVNTVHKEPLKDGAFSVLLDTVERNSSAKNRSIIAGGIRAYAVKKDWAVNVTVVHENNRFVVDDVRIFEGQSTNSPSRLLSQSFEGCDGPQWVGASVTK